MSFWWEIEPRAFKRGASRWPPVTHPCIEVWGNCFKISMYGLLYLRDDVQYYRVDKVPRLYLCSPGITLPSAFSAIYFLLFIGVCTWWACHFPISHLGFNVLCVMVGFFTAGHLVCLYLYQCPIAQGIFPPASLWARSVPHLYPNKSFYSLLVIVFHVSSTYSALLLTGTGSSHSDAPGCHTSSRL